MKARYVRISTPNQKLERQLIKSHPKENLFIDVCSGSIPFDLREQGAKLLAAKDVTYLSVHAIDRLGRNLIDILNTLKIFADKGVVLKVDSLGVESIVKGKPNPAFNLLVTVMGQVAEMERDTMLERQREGIAIAKAKGTYKGRVKGSTESKDVILERYPLVVKELKTGTNSLRKIAKLSDVGLSTVQKVKRVLG